MQSSEKGCRDCGDTGQKADAGNAGSTLVEMLIVTVMISILAAAALPSAQKAAQRRDELELRRTLRTVRTAIDQFHEDWRNGIIVPPPEAVSANGYPRDLRFLVEGVRGGDPDRRHRRYLRRMPLHAFPPAGGETSRLWILIGYDDEGDSANWGGVDIYDLRANTDDIALDGTPLSSW